MSTEKAENAWGSGLVWLVTLAFIGLVAYGVTKAAGEAKHSYQHINGTETTK